MYWSIPREYPHIYQYMISTSGKWSFRILYKDFLSPYQSWEKNIIKTIRLLTFLKVDVGRVDANVHPELSLLEHILLKMDFNYLDTVGLQFVIILHCVGDMSRQEGETKVSFAQVPPSQKLQFRMPDPLR